MKALQGGIKSEGFSLAAKAAEACSHRRKPMVDSGLIMKP